MKSPEEHQSWAIRDVPGVPRSRRPPELKDCPWIPDSAGRSPLACHGRASGRTPRSASSRRPPLGRTPSSNSVRLPGRRRNILKGCSDNSGLYRWIALRREFSTVNAPSTVTGSRGYLSLGFSKLRYPVGVREKAESSDLVNDL